MQLQLCNGHCMPLTFSQSVKPSTKSHSTNDSMNVSACLCIFATESIRCIPVSRVQKWHQRQPPKRMAPTLSRFSRHPSRCYSQLSRRALTALTELTNLLRHPPPVATITSQCGCPRMSADVSWSSADVSWMFADVRGCPRMFPVCPRMSVDFCGCPRMFSGCPRMYAEVSRMSTSVSQMSADVSRMSADVFRIGCFVNVCGCPRMSADVPRMSAHVRGCFPNVCGCFPDVRGCFPDVLGCPRMFRG